MQSSEGEKQLRGYICGVCRKRLSDEEYCSISPYVDALRKKWGQHIRLSSSHLCKHCKEDIELYLVERERRNSHLRDSPSPSAKTKQTIELPKDVREWTVTDVGLWLESLLLAQYKDVFANHEIDGELLLELTEINLRNEFKVRDNFHVKKILKGISVLKQKLNRLSSQNGANGDSSSSASSSVALIDGPIALRSVGAYEWEIDYRQLQIGELIGSGTYGDVRRGSWNGLEVAIKVLRDQELSDDMVEQFKSEVHVMSKLRHPNCVLLLGACVKSPHLAIVTPNYRKGSLRRVLCKSPINIAWHRRVQMALDVALGMAYLHDKKIVHRDLKSPNLMVEKNWAVRVGDFGQTKVKSHTQAKFSTMQGTFAWMAPEVLRNEPYDEKADVFSFGVILWEIVKREDPWRTVSPYAVVGLVGFQGKRLEIPSVDEIDFPYYAEYRKLMEQCFDENPAKRPTFAEMVPILKQLVVDIKLLSPRASADVDMDKDD